LSISFGIIRKHGGTLDALSVEGEGTQMIIRVPLERPVGTNTTSQET
jgi:signal transduction histidine kinase